VTCDPAAIWAKDLEIQWFVEDPEETETDL
jgi:hypothetical protein